ncbi:MAG: hypothetical protein Q4D35_06765, partial [Ruminococcus sp.]|nr:hypothetical protein [Ruminococcus sp.]
SHKLVVQGQDGSISNVKIIGSKSSTSSDSSSSKPDSSSNTDSSSTASSDSKVIAQKGSGSLAWDTSYSIDFSLAGYKSAKVVFTGNAGALKLAVDPGWTELVETSGVSGSYTYTFTPAQIAAFSGSHKLVVQGQDGSISNVKILASTGSSVSDNPTPVLPEIVGEPEVAQMSITLTGIIGANVLYSIPEGYVNNYYNIEAVFSAPGVTSVTVPLNKRSYQMINGKKAYIFTLPIKPCDMNKEFNARLVIKKASDGTNAAPVLRNTVVLADYVNAYALSTDPIKKAFGQAMQTYGYYAQKNFNPDEELPNIKLINLNDVTVSTVADYEADVRPYRGTKKAEILQTTLYLDSGTGIRTYITDIDSSVDKSNLYMQYTVNGVSKRVKVQTNASGDYYGEISDVPANNLSKMYEIKFLEGTTQITDTSMYGAFSYIYSTLRSTASADTKNLAKVLYKYAIAAEAIIPEPSDNSGLDTTVTPSTNENFGDYIGTIPNVDISGSKLYSQDNLVKNFGSFGNLYDKSMYENGSGSNVGIIFAGWNEENYFNDPSLDFKLNFFAEGGDYNIRRMTFVPTYYLATYDEGIKLNDSHTLTPSQQAEIMSEALKMGVRLNYRLHIDPWRFAWGSESYSEVNPDIPGSQWWRGMFTEIHPMADDYMGMINQGFEALEETFAKIGNTKLAEPVRFDIGAELMTSIKRYSDEWVQLAEYCKERINASAALRGNVVIGFNFCHHVEYLLEIEDHEDYFNRVTASGESYEDHLDILYVDDMNQQERQNMADFIRSLDVFSVSQYMPMDIFEPADKTNPNAVTTTPEDVRDALLTHEQNFLQKVLIGKLGIAPEDIPPMSIGEYGMGIKGLTAPNVWETDNWDASELVTYEAQKKHVEIAIKGLLLYMQDERTVAKSLTIWISGAPYDFLNFYPSMNLGHGPEGSSPAQGYPGKEAFNPPAAQALIDYCGGTKKVY